MVNAILEGRKTQTRRVIKGQPSDHHWSLFPDYSLQAKVLPCANNGGSVFVTWTHRIKSGFDCHSVRPISPFGQPGDRLWVREAWRTGKGLDQLDASGIKLAANEAGYERGPLCPLYYESDGRHLKWSGNDKRDFGEKGRYRHGRFMPHWASRLTLEITAIRAERLQDISDDDALAEGIYWHEGMEGWVADDEGRCFNCGSPSRAFENLWCMINGPESWGANVWVWVLEFRGVEG